MAKALKTIGIWQEEVLIAKNVQELGCSLHNILFDIPPDLFFIEIKFSGVLPWLGPTSQILQKKPGKALHHSVGNYHDFKKISGKEKKTEISLKLPSWDPGVLFLAWKGDFGIESAKERLKVLAPSLSLLLPNLALGEAHLPFRSRSKDFFQALLENSTDFMVFMEGAEARFVSSNCKAILGFTPNEVMALINDNLALIHPDDLPQLVQKIQEEQNKKLSFGKHQYRIRKKNGEYVWFEWLVRRFFDKEGKFSHSILNCRDVTSQIEAEKERGRQKNLLNDILDLIPVDVFIKGKDGKYLFVNKSVCESLMVKKEDLIGKKDIDIFPDHLAKAFISGDKLVKQGKPFDNIEEKTIIHGRERIYLAKKSMVNLYDQKKEVILGTSIEVTERVKSEKKARETSVLINNIAQLLPESLFVFDLEKFSYVYSNYKLFNKLGYSEKEFEDPIPGKKLSHDFLASIFQKGEFLRYHQDLKEIGMGKREFYESEYLLKNKKGEDVFILSRKLPFKRNEKGEVTQFVGLTIDITEQKKRELELEKAREQTEKALRSKDEFLSVMSHEIRTPLNAIIGISNLLKEDRSNIHVPERLKALKFSADKLLLLVNDILDFSKVQSGGLAIKKSAFDFDDLVEDIYQTFVLSALEKGLKFKLIRHQKLSRLLIGDEGRISQVLFNLLSNAIKFTEEGEVLLIVEEKNRKGNKIEMLIEVKDTGIGIDPEKAERIFDPFFQLDQKTNRSYGGTGLGLTISKKITEAHGGKLKVRSILDRGSSFQVTIPFDLKKKSKEPHERPHTRKEKGSKKIPKVLYVEDVESNRELMKGISELWGFDLSTAKDGSEGLKMIGKKNFDLILLDIQMPGMDGFEVLEKMKGQRGADIPVYAITADTSDKNIKALEKAGTIGFIPKPFDPRDLKNAIFFDARTNGGKKSRSAPIGKPKFKSFQGYFGRDRKKLIDFYRTLSTELANEIKKLKKFTRKAEFQVFKESVHKIKGAIGESAPSQLAYLFEKIKDSKPNRFPTALREELIRQMELYLRHLELEINPTEIARKGNP
jgi:PAS domain S-box-containing protein